MRFPSKWMAAAGLLTGPWFALVVTWYAAALPGYLHARHPPALLGALGAPGATAFNLLGFVTAGVLALLAVEAVYAALRAGGAGFIARTGTTLLLLSAVAFIAQGVFPLDMSQPLDIGPSRIHVALWTLWWMAAMLGALVAAIGVRTLRGWRSLLSAGIMVAVLIPLALMTDLGGLGTGWRQRLALAAWFGWIAWASWLARRQP